jgi:putative hydrolase of the HAD superfamily
MWSDLEQDLLVWVDQLCEAGYKTAILSNLNREFATHMRTECGWIERFDAQVFSSEIGQIKPDPEIYRHCLQLLDSSPDEALFIDDREINVAAARKEGIRSLLYRSIDQLRPELEAMGLKVLHRIQIQQA